MWVYLQVRVKYVYIQWSVESASSNYKSFQEMKMNRSKIIDVVLEQLRKMLFE